MIKSGVRATTVSMLGLMPPTLGSRQASCGYLQKSVTPTTLWLNPNAKRVSVMEGEVEMIRLADLKPLLSAQSKDAERNNSRSTTGNTEIVLIIALVRL